MDKLGVRRQKIPRLTVTRRQKREKKTNSRKEQQVQQPIKVIHYSDQVRITTTPFDFKSRVQELTGLNSNVAAMFASQDPDAWGADSWVLPASFVLSKGSSSTGSSSDSVDGSHENQILFEGDDEDSSAFNYDDFEVDIESLLDELGDLPVSKPVAAEPGNRCITDEEL